MVSVPCSLSPESRNGGGQVQFLFLGLIINDKGIFDVLKVLAGHKSLFFKKLKLIIAGNGDVARLSGIIREHQLEDIVEFKGWVNGAGKDELFRRTDVFILPSYYEGLPVAVLEAMSYGKAIISTQVGGIPELVEVNGNGVLIQPGDQKAILESLLFYVNDPNNIIIHGNRSLQIIENYFPQNIVPKLEAIYAGLLNQTQVTWQP